MSTAPAPAPVEEPRRSGVAAALAFMALTGLVAARAGMAADAPFALALIAPTVVAAAIAVAARPEAGVIILFAAVGFSGTLLAYTPIPGAALIDFVLLGLWMGTAWRLLMVPGQPIWLLPGVLLLGLYIVVTLADAAFTSPVSDGIASIHLSIWLMSAVFLVGLSSWQAGAYWTIVRGILVVAILVGAYALLRTITGPTEAERQLALTGKPGFLSLKTSGSLPSAGHLASWCTALLPFSLAMALSLRGRWQLAAGVATGLTMFAVLATEVRTGIVAAVAGGVVVVLLWGLSRAFSSQVKTVRLAGTALIAVILIGGAYATTIGTNDESSSRFERILDPENDFAYSTRLVRWEEALEVMSENPFGKGLGTLGAVALTKPIDPELIRQLDSSYIKVGVEQGPWVLGLFAVALLALLANLAWRSINTTDRGKALLGIAATGTLAAVIISFYANTYVEEPPILAGWLLVGLGLAQLSRPQSSPLDSGLRDATV